MRRKRTSRYIMVLLVIAAVALTGCMRRGEVVDVYDTITGPLGTKESHWWDEVEYKKAVDMSGKKLELKYMGTYLLINYIKYVNTETDEEIVWTDFASAKPDGSTVEIANIADYKSDNTKWAIRTDHMGDVGGASLHSMVGMSLPNIILGPELVGTHDIYFGIRAVDYPQEFGVRIVAE